MITQNSQKFGQFKRLNFTERYEKAFDRTFNYERELREIFQYRKVTLKGTVIQRTDMIVVDRSLQSRQAKEQSQTVEQNQNEKKSLYSNLKLSTSNKKILGLIFGM
ncbi:DUF5712 family protein [Dyadobacter flavalbus]|uniref:DUF5712 family protein n=1 Tax=Dyadobacter flavalbus TaxID=2579942 RepID=UPI0035B57DF3